MGNNADSENGNIGNGSLDEFAEQSNDRKLQIMAEMVFAYWKDYVLTSDR